MSDLTKMNIEDWPDHWREVTDKQQRSSLKAELEKEVSEGHPLWDKLICVIARRNDKDYILVKMQGDELSYAEVHLTWSAIREPDARWPRASFFSSLSEWRRSTEY